MAESLSSGELLHLLRDLRQRVDGAIALVSEQDRSGETLTTSELSGRLGIGPQALSSWARSHGPGAVRGEWLLLGRQGGGLRARWLWQRLDP
jgi:predicted solute-binding protein